MKIYLASRYSRRLELCDYRETLRTLGHEVTSRWLDGSHQISDNGTPIGEDGESLVEFVQSDAAAQLRQHFATEDLADIDAADVLVAFTEPPRSSASRGGRHTELGYAIAKDTRIIIVGPRENVFCWLPWIDAYDTWDEALAAWPLSAREDVADYVPF